MPGTDLAFLLIDPPYALAWVPLADADHAVVGASVYTIGHSEWLKNTVLGGRLTSVLREEFSGENHVTALRLNFDMEKGDSGWPVLNSRGELLGIVEAGATGGQGDITIAIAANAIAIAYKAYLEKLDQK